MLGRWPRGQGRPSASGVQCLLSFTTFRKPGLLLLPCGLPAHPLLPACDCPAEGPNTADLAPGIPVSGGGGPPYYKVKRTRDALRNRRSSSGVPLGAPDVGGRFVARCKTAKFQKLGVTPRRARSCPGGNARVFDLYFFSGLSGRSAGSGFSSRAHRSRVLRLAFALPHRWSSIARLAFWDGRLTTGSVGLPSLGDRWIMDALPLRFALCQACLPGSACPGGPACGAAPRTTPAVGRFLPHAATNTAKPAPSSAFSCRPASALFLCLRPAAGKPKQNQNKTKQPSRASGATGPRGGRKSQRAAKRHSLHSVGPARRAGRGGERRGPLLRVPC